MNRERFSLRETEYPAIRRVMGPDRERLDDEGLERVLGEQFPGARPDDVENFMRGLQSLGRQIAPLAQRALPGAIQGAVQGGAVGGPLGAFAGAGFGAGKSLLGGGGARPAQPPGPARGPVPPLGAPASLAPPSAPPPAPALLPPGVSGIAPGGAPAHEPAEPTLAVPPALSAIQQLVTILSRPETLNAMQAMLMPGTGRDTIPVGGKEVPVVAFANAIAETAALVAEAAGHPLEQAYSEYLFDDVGRPRGDLINPSERAALLLSDLAAVAAAEALAEHDEADEGEDLDAYVSGESDEADPLEAYEEALRGISREY